MIEQSEQITLVRRISQGDEQAFHDLYEATCRRVFHYLCRLTQDRHLAEDLAADTYVAVWKSSGKFRGDSQVITWIIGIARNIAMNEFRKNRRQEQELNEEIMTEASQFNNCATTESVQLLTDAINRLPVLQREIIDLVFMQGMNYEEISTIIDIPVNTVKTRVFHAKKKLRNTLHILGVKQDDIA